MCLFSDVEFLPFIPHCVVGITRYLPVTIKMTSYYVLSDKLCSYMFQPLGGHHQAIKIHESKITKVTGQ
jgi:hypothetical protein